MELLRDNQVVAINDVLVATYDLIEVLRASADEAREAEDVDNAVGDEFGAKADELGEKSRQLGQIVRRLGDSPASASDERLIFDQAALRLKSSLSSDTAATLREAVRQAERDLGLAIDEALPDIKDDEARGIVAGLTG